MHPPSPRTAHAVTHPASRVPVALPRPRAAVDAAGAEPAGAIGPAWIVRTVTHVPGVLQFADGRLSFLSSRGVVFDVALDEVGGPDVDLTLPWHGRGHFRLTVAGERLSVHVVRPAGALEPGRAFVDAVAEASGLPATGGDATAAAIWRTLLLSAVGPRPRRSAGRRAVRSRRASGDSTPPS